MVLPDTVVRNDAGEYFLLKTTVTPIHQHLDHPAKLCSRANTKRRRLMPRRRAVPLAQAERQRQATRHGLAVAGHFATPGLPPASSPLSRTLAAQNAGCAPQAL